MLRESSTETVPFFATGLLILSSPGSELLELWLDSFESSSTTGKLLMMQGFLLVDPIS